MNASRPNHEPSALGGTAILGRIAGLAVLCVALALMVDAWLATGWLPGLQVASGSMAPALRGPHRRAICPRCQSEIICDIDSNLAIDGGATCPHCESPIDASLFVARPGDRVVVDRSEWRRGGPARWQVVACRQPDEPRAACVKRVVGLPGETVEIRRGDVYINDQIVRKDLATLRALAVPVSGSARQRWRAESAGTWQFDQGRFVHAGGARSAGDEARIDWLRYQPLSPQLASRIAADDVIFDESFYDPDESRTLHPIRDVLLRCRARIIGPGRIWLRADVAGERFVASLDSAASEITLSHNGSIVATGADASALARGGLLEWALVDQQAILAVDGRTVIECAFQPAREGDAAVRFVALGANEGQIEIDELQLLRDVYYTDDGLARRREFQLAADEYFLLGDNSAHSVDSRVWRPAGVRRDQILGRAIVWPR